MIEFVKAWLKMMAILTIGISAIGVLMVFVGWAFTNHPAIALGLFFLLATAAMAVIFRPTE